MTEEPQKKPPEALPTAETGSQQAPEPPKTAPEARTGQPMAPAAAVEPPQNGKKPRNVKELCRYVRTNHQTGEKVRCGRPAIRGGFCLTRSHGGRVKSDLDMKKQFRLGKLYNNHLKAIRKDRRAIYSMEQELAMSKSMVSMLRAELKRKGMDSEEESPELDAGSLRLIKQINEAIESVVKITERIYKIEQQEKQKFDAEAIGEIVGSVGAIIKRHVKDEATLHAIGEELGQVAETYG